MTIFARGTAAPITSVTTPSILPVSVCAPAKVPSAVSTIAAKSKFETRLKRGKHITVELTRRRGSANFDLQNFMRDKLSRLASNDLFGPFFRGTVFFYLVSVPTNIKRNETGKRFGDSVNDEWFECPFLRGFESWHV